MSIFKKIMYILIKLFNIIILYHEFNLNSIKMFLKRIIVFLFIISFGGSLIFLVFWDIPAPIKKIEKNIDINRLKSND